MIFIRERTDWDEYEISPDSFFHRKLLLNRISKSYRRILKNVDFDRPIKILEFGCGTGYVNLLLCDLFDVKEITLVDFNKDMLETTKNTLENINCKKSFLNKDFFEINLSDKYNLVHSAGVIEHLKKTKRLELLKKHYKTTKPGGFCMVYFPTPTRSYRLFRKIHEKLNSWKFHDEVPLKKERVIEEMKDFGFKPIGIDYFWRYYLTEVGVLFRRPG